MTSIRELLDAADEHVALAAASSRARTAPSTRSSASSLVSSASVSMATAVPSVPVQHLQSLAKAAQLDAPAAAVFDDMVVRVAEQQGQPRPLGVPAWQLAVVASLPRLLNAAATVADPALRQDAVLQVHAWYQDRRDNGAPAGTGVDKAPASTSRRSVTSLSKQRSSNTSTVGSVASRVSSTNSSRSVVADVQPPAPGHLEQLYENDTERMLFRRPTRAAVTPASFQAFKMPPGEVKRPLGLETPPPRLEPPLGTSPPQRSKRSASKPGLGGTGGANGDAHAGGGDGDDNADEGDEDELPERTELERHRFPDLDAWKQEHIRRKASAKKHHRARQAALMRLAQYSSVLATKQRPRAFDPSLELGVYHQRDLVASLKHRNRELGQGRDEDIAAAIERVGLARAQAAETERTTGEATTPGQHGFAFYAMESAREKEMDAMWLRRRETQTNDEQFEREFQTALEDWSATKSRLEEEVARKLESSRFAMTQSDRFSLLRTNSTVLSVREPGLSGAMPMDEDTRDDIADKAQQQDLEYPRVIQRSKTPDKGADLFQRRFELVADDDADDDADVDQLDKLDTDALLHVSDAASVPCFCARCRRQRRPKTAPPGYAMLADERVRSLSPYNHIHFERKRVQMHEPQRSMTVAALDHDATKLSRAQALQDVETNRIRECFKTHNVVVRDDTLHRGLHIPADRSVSVCLGALPMPGSSLLRRADVYADDVRGAKKKGKAGKGRKGSAGKKKPVRR